MANKDYKDDAIHEMKQLKIREKCLFFHRNIQKKYLTMDIMM